MHVECMTPMHLTTCSYSATAPALDAARFKFIQSDVYEIEGLLTVINTLHAVRPRPAARLMAAASPHINGIPMSENTDSMGGTS